jgi:hypothetical protein
MAMTGAKNAQHKAFVKVARELGVDESEAAFDRVLKKVASAKPVSVSKPTKRTPKNHKK